MSDWWPSESVWKRKRQRRDHERTSQKLSKSAFKTKNYQPVTMPTEPDPERGNSDPQTTTKPQQQRNGAFHADDVRWHKLSSPLITTTTTVSPTMMRMDEDVIQVVRGCNSTVISRLNIPRKRKKEKGIATTLQHLPHKIIPFLSIDKHFGFLLYSYLHSSTLYSDLPTTPWATRWVDIQQAPLAAIYV